MNFKLGPTVRLWLISHVLRKSFDIMKCPSLMNGAWIKGSANRICC